MIGSIPSRAAPATATVLILWVHGWCPQTFTSHVCSLHKGSFTQDHPHRHRCANTTTPAQRTMRKTTKLRRTSSRHHQWHLRCFGSKLSHLPSPWPDTKNGKTTKTQRGRCGGGGCWDVLLALRFEYFYMLHGRNLLKQLALKNQEGIPSGFESSRKFVSFVYCRFSQIVTQSCCFFTSVLDQIE